METVVSDVLPKQQKAFDFLTCFLILTRPVGIGEVEGSVWDEEVGGVVTNFPTAVAEVVDDGIL
jgi:hypothetical protein